MPSNDPYSPRPTDKPQLTLEEVRAMHPLDRAQAFREGRCRDVLTNGDPDRQSGYGQHAPRQSDPPQGRDFQDIVKARKSAP